MSVIRKDAGDKLTFQWGEDGTPFEFDPKDEIAGLAAYKKAVACGLAAGDAGSMNETERAVGLDISGYLGIRKDAGDAVMIAWYPDPEQAAAIKAIMPDGSVALEDLHMTLLFLGDPDQDGTKWDMDLLAAALKLWSTRQGPCECKIGGAARFISDGDQDAIVALVDCPWIANLRESLRNDLSYACALPYSSEVYNPSHGFIPHITLSYVPQGSAVVPAMDAPMDIKIESIRLAAGAERTSDFPFYSMMQDEATADPTPFYMSVAERTLEVIAKAGRVISGTNMKKLDEIISHAQDIKSAEMSRRSVDEGDVNKDIEGEMEYLIEKSTVEGDWQYTFGPLYAPNRKDAHNEWATADTLQKSLHEFVQSRFDEGNNRLNLQHNDHGDVTVGNIVEFVAWPSDHVVKMTTPEGKEVEQEFPAGTVWLGVKWDGDAWPLVKSGKIGGFSMGGKAVRILGGEGETMKDMGYKVPTRKSADDAPVGDDGAIHVHVHRS